MGLLGPLNCGTGDVIMLGGGPPAYSGAGTAFSALALPELTASCLAALVTSAGATPVGVSLSSVCALPAAAHHGYIPRAPGSCREESSHNGASPPKHAALLYCLRWRTTDGAHGCLLDHDGDHSWWHTRRCMTELFSCIAPHLQHNGKQEGDQTLSISDDECEGLTDNGSAHGGGVLLVVVQPGGGPILLVVMLWRRGSGVVLVVRLDGGCPTYLVRKVPGRRAVVLLLLLQEARHVQAGVLTLKGIARACRYTWRAGAGAADIHGYEHAADAVDAILEQVQSACLAL